MLNLEKNKERAYSPKKINSIFNIFEKDKVTSKTNSSPSPDLKPFLQNSNNSFSSPLSKKLQTKDKDSLSKSNSNNDNKNNIYSPYVKRIDISGSKIEIVKDNNYAQNNCFTSYKSLLSLSSLFTSLYVLFSSTSLNFVVKLNFSIKLIPLFRGINLSLSFSDFIKLGEGV